MSDRKIEELRAENVQIHERMVELNELPADEFGAEAEEEWERLSKQFDRNKAARERLETADAVARDLESFGDESVGQRQREQPDATPEPEQHEPTDEERAQLFDRAFRKYLRNGPTGMTPEERQIVSGDGTVALEKRAQSVGTTTAGGHAVPDALMATLEENMLAFGGLRRAPINFVQTADGRDWPIPSVDDTGNAGTILAENTQASDVDATFSQIVLEAFKFTSGIIKVSSELMEDASFDVADWAVGAVGERIARGLAPHLIEGDGSAEPGGLDLAGSFITAAGAAAITRGDIIDLIHNVDPAYRASPAFRLVLGDSTLAAIKKLAVGTSDDRPLWVPSMREGAPDTIEGVPYFVDQTVAAIGAGNRSMYAGDLRKFWLRQAGPVRIRRLDERYADFDQVAFVGFARFDSDIIDSGTDPIHYLRHPAS